MNKSSLSLKVTLLAFALSWSSITNAQTACRRIHRPATAFSIINEMERTYQDAIFNRNLTPYEKSQEISWYNISGRRIQKKLNQDILVFKHPENVNAFLKDLLEVVYPGKLFKNLFKFSATREEELNKLARWHIIQKGVDGFIENANIPLTKKPVWKKVIQAGIKYSIFTHTIFDPMKVKLEPEIAEKILLNGLDKLTESEKSAANKQYLKMYALKNAQFLSKVFSYTMLVVLYLDFEQNQNDEINKTRVIEIGEDLDRAGAELNKNLGPEFLEKTKQLHLDLLVNDFKKSFKRDPTPDELMILRNFVQAEN